MIGPKRVNDRGLVESAGIDIVFIIVPPAVSRTMRRQFDTRLGKLILPGMGEGSSRATGTTGGLSEPVSLGDNRDTAFGDREALCITGGIKPNLFTRGNGHMLVDDAAAQLCTFAHGHSLE